MGLGSGLECRRYRAWSESAEMVSGRRGCAGLGGESCWVLDAPSATGERAERPSGRQGGKGAEGEER